MPTITSNIKKSNTTKVQVKNLPALPNITKVPYVYKNNITTVPYVYKNNITTAPGVFKNTILQLPDVKKTDILKYNPYVSARYSKNSDWEEVEKKAKMAANYNDPRQLNSIPDAVAALFNPDIFEGEGNRFKRIWDSFYNLYITPVKEGEWKIFGGNMLISGLETLNTLSNIVKAPLLGPAEDGLDYLGMMKDDFIDQLNNPGDDPWDNPNLPILYKSQLHALKRTIGVEGEGRYNYDWDTGNGWLDFILECVCDPGVWASLASMGGAKGVATGAFKKIVKEGGEVIVKETTETVIKVGTETYVKTAVVEFAEKTAKSGLKEIAEEIGEYNMKRWMKRAVLETFDAARHGKTINIAELAKSLSDVASNKMVGKLTKKFSKEFADDFAKKVTLEVVNDLAEVVVKMSKAEADTLAMRIITAVDDLDFALFKVPFWTTTPIIPTYKVFKKIFNMHNTRILRILKPYIKEAKTFTVVDYERLMKQADEVGSSLVAAAEDAGIKGLKNTEIQKAVFKNTKQAFNEIQRIIKRGVGGKSITPAGVKILIEDLQAYLKTTFKFADDMSIEDMFKSLTDLLQTVSKEAPIFETLEKTLAKITDNWFNITKATQVSETIDFILKNTKLFEEGVEDAGAAVIKNNMFTADDLKNFIKDSTIDVEVLTDKINKFVHQNKQLPQKYLINAIVGDILIDDFIEPLFKNNIFNKNIPNLDYSRKNFMEYLELIRKDYVKQINDLSRNKHEVDALLDYKLSLVVDTMEYIKTVEKFFKGKIRNLDQLEKIIARLPEILNKASNSYAKRLYNNIQHYIKTKKDLIRPLTELTDLVQTKTGSGLYQASTVQKKIQELISQTTNTAKKVETNIALDTIEELHKNLGDILEEFETTSLSKVVSAAQDELLPLTDAIANAIKDLEDIANAIIKSKPIDVNVLQDILLDLNKTITSYKTSVRNMLQESGDVNEYFMKYGPHTWEDVKHTVDVNNKYFYGHTSFLFLQKQKEFISSVLENYTVAKKAYNEATTKLKEAEIKYHNLLDEYKTFKEKPTVLKEAYTRYKALEKNVQKQLRLLEGYENRLDLFRSDGLIQGGPYIERASVNLYHKYDELFDKVESMVNIIQDNLQIKGSEFSVIGDGVWYALKQEQTLNALTYLTEEPIAKVIHEIADDTFVYSDFLKDFTNKENVQSLIDKITDETHSNLSKAYTRYKALEKNIQKQTKLIQGYEKRLELFKADGLISGGYRTASHAVDDNVSRGYATYLFLKNQKERISPLFTEYSALTKKLNDTTLALKEAETTYHNFLNMSNNLEETKSMLLQISEACENVMKGVDSVIAYEQLINSLENSTAFSLEIKSAIHSTLNKHTIAQTKVDKIAANRTAFIDELAKNIEDYVNAKRKTQSYKLDDFRAAKSEEGFFEYLLGISKEVWKNMAHHSDADCFTTEYFAKENNIDLGKNYMIIDAETTGTVSEASELLEFSVRTSEGQTIVFKRHLKEGDTAFNPSNSLLQSVYSDGTKNSNELIANYRAYYNRDYKGPQFANTVEYFDSEADLINAVVGFIHKNSYLEFDKKTKQILKGHPNNTKIVGHNISNFDIDYLIKRAKANDEQLRYFTEDTLKKFDIIDTYKEMQLRDGIFKFDKAQKQALEKTLQPYMVLREVLDDTGATLYHSGEDFINALPKELDTGLQNLSDIFKNKTNTLRNLGIEDTTDYWGPFQKQLAEARGLNIRDINKILNQIIFTKDQVMSDAFKEGLAKILKEERNSVLNTIGKLNKFYELNAAFVPDLAKTQKYFDDIIPTDKTFYGSHLIDYSALSHSGKVSLKNNIPQFYRWTDEQIDAYVEYLNTSKALYSSNDFINTLGYKKIFDAKLVRTWFNTPADVLDYKTATLMFNTARVLDNQTKYIINPNAILQYESVITDFLNDIKIKALFEDTGNPVFKYLNMDTGSIAEKYTLAKYLYNTVEASGLTNKLDKIKLASMADLLEEHQLFTHRTISDTTLTFAEQNRLFMDGETGQLGSKFNALLEDFKNTIRSFNLSNAFDDMQVFSPARQLYAKGAAKVSNLLEYVTHLAKKATTKQLYDMQSKLYFITDNLNKQTLRNVLDTTSSTVLLRNLAWTGGIIRFNIADAPDLYERFIKYADKLKAQGIKVTEDGQNLWLNIDRSRVKYSCDILQEEGVSVKHIYVDGIDLSRPALKELDVKAAIEATKEEFKLPGKSIVGGVLTDTELDELCEHIIEARKGLITTTEGLAAGVHADVASKKTFRYIYEQAPKAVQDSFGDVDTFLDEPGWFSETFFNLSNLGTISSKQMLQPGAPSHLIHTYKLNTELALKTQDTKLKYIYNMMNNDMRLDIGIWADSANDEAIIKYLKEHSDLSVAVLYKTNKGRGFDIRRIKINTIEDLNNARRLRATILTDDMYYKTASVISTSIFESGALNAISKIIQIYKLGVLSMFNLGGIMRNFADATFKEVLSLEDVLSVPRAQYTATKNLKKYNKTLNYLIASADLNTETIERIAKTYGVTPEDVLKDINFNVAKIKKGQLQNVINATVLYTKYNTALDEIIKMDSNAILRPQNIDFYFNYITKNFDKDTFYEVHRFITEGASAGETKALQEVLDNTLVKKGLVDSAESKGVLDSVLHFMSKLASPNQSIEQIVRLSQHMEQLKRGMSFAESSAKIAKVHFNYADKVDATRMIEILFPFFNFKMKNFEYWVDTLTTNRWVGRMFEEYTQGVWDFDNYDTYQEHLEFANNQSLQYQISSGSIPLFDTGLRIKVNPSFMDVMQTVTDPFGTAQNSLFAPFKAAFKLCALDEYNKANVLDAVAEGIPLLGPLHQQYAKSMGVDYAERLNKQNISPTAQFFAKALPSVFTVTSRWNLENIKSPEEWEANGIRYRRNYYAKQNAKAAQRRVYKSYGGYSKKVYAKRVYPKKIYPKKTYAKKTYAKKTYAKKTYYNTSYSRYHKYSTGNRYYNSYNPGYAKFVEYYNKPYNRYSEYSTIKASRNVKQPQYENIYWKYYTKTGKRRMDILNAKATQKNLQMKIKLMYDYYR